MASVLLKVDPSLVHNPKLYQTMRTIAEDVLKEIELMFDVMDYPSFTLRNLCLG
uniref:Peptide deformylase n=1 Tax=Steinernema glaseri TaxID=37863 RepID=A0A1I7Z8T3_9BILA